VSDAELKKTAEKQTAQIIKRELDKKNYEETAWLKAFKKAKGNEEEARAIYAEIRESILLEELYKSLRDKVDQQIAEVEWYRREQNKRKEERKLSYENYAKRNNYSEAEKKKLLEKHFGKEDDANTKNLHKKEPPLTDYEKQQIKNKYLKNIESNTSTKSDISEKSFIGRFIDGEVPLVISYWIVAVLIPTIIYGADIGINGDTSLVVAFILLVYYVFAFIGTWKSAGNYIRQNDPPFWGYTARVVLVLGLVKLAVNLITGR